MFFDDLVLFQRKKAVLCAPPIPATDWRLPQYYPNLLNALVISFDTETYDPGLEEYGPGWARGPVGYICGVSIAAIMPTGERYKGYFPVRHTVATHDNLDPKHTFAWLKAMLETPHIPKLGANLLYDIGWLTEENIYVSGPLYDIQIAEALLNESGEINLDYLGAKYIGAGKDTSALYTWCSQAFGGDANQRQRANIYRCPPRLVGNYAEADADIPLDVWERQKPLLEADELTALFRLECDLIPLLVRMRRNGVQIDEQRAEQLYGEFGNRKRELQAELDAKAGFEVNTAAADSIARLFDAEGIRYPRTAKGAPSFRKDFLKNLEHPIATQINYIREVEKLRGTFIKSYLLEGSVKGRIHCSFNALRSDDGGTRTGRFSASDPNLQNIPVRSEDGAKIRSAFICDRHAFQWRKKDYSQIEYRFHVHYAVGPGAEEVRQQYINDPTTDYHVLTQLLVKAKTGKDVERKPIKNINFGLLYGMGQAKLARQLGLDDAAAKELFAAYHEGNPYTKATMEAVAREAQELGYITTILGRRRRFNLWEPEDIDYDNRAIALPYNEAIRYYGSNIRRAHTHKAINSRYQGSAADQMKAGMHALLTSGVFDYTGVPLLTVHDELDFSQNDDSPATREAYRYIEHTLETVIKLRIPIKVETSIGANWGAAK